MKTFSDRKCSQIFCLKVNKALRTWGCYTVYTDNFTSWYLKLYIEVLTFDINAILNNGQEFFSCNVFFGRGFVILYAGVVLWLFANKALWKVTFSHFVKIWLVWHAHTLSQPKICTLRLTLKITCKVSCYWRETSDHLFVAPWLGGSRCAHSNITTPGEGYKFRLARVDQCSGPRSSASSVNNQLFGCLHPFYVSAHVWKLLVSLVSRGY